MVVGLGLFGVMGIFTTFLAIVINKQHRTYGEHNGIQLGMREGYANYLTKRGKLDEAAGILDYHMQMISCTEFIEVRKLLDKREHERKAMKR